MDGGWPDEAPHPDVDYEDAFTASVPDALSRSPEIWAREVLEGASWPMRAFLRVGWRYFLCFRLARDNAVLGWPVVASDDGWVALEQSSWLYDVVLLMRASEHELTWATRVTFRSPASRPVWWIVGAIHRRYAPRALQRASAARRSR
jgi:hypothetical protein